MSDTVLDRAHRAMAAAPEDAALRLRFYQRLVDAELFVLLDGAAAAGRMRPRVFPLAEGPVVLAFDREDRLAGFVEGPADHAEMTGRALAPMLAEARLGLGLNLGAAPSAILLPAAAMAWLAGLLALRPGRREGLPEAVTAPAAAPAALLAALDAKLPGLAGLADHAVLVAADYGGAERGLVLAFGGAVPGAEDALARAAGEALVFSGQAEGTMDVAFPGAEALVRFARVGLRFDIPKVAGPAERAAPGTKPEAPPRLR